MTDFSAVQWRKSSRSSDEHGQCVEVAAVSGVVGVRDSKDPAGAVLEFGQAEVTAFAARVKAGELDL